METQPAAGQITIAPEVLETLAVPGVVRMAPASGVKRLLRHDGVELDIVGNRVSVRLHVVAEPDADMLLVGRRIQAEVARAIRDMVGMDVESIDVHIEDVAYVSEEMSAPN